MPPPSTRPVVEQKDDIAYLEPEVESKHFLGIEISKFNPHHENKAYSKERGTAPRQKKGARPAALHPSGLITEDNPPQTMASAENTTGLGPLLTDSFAPNGITKLVTKANEPRSIGKQASTNREVESEHRYVASGSGHHGQLDNARPQVQEGPGPNAAQDAWLAHRSQDYHNYNYQYPLIPLQPWCWYRIPSGAANPAAAASAPAVPAQANRPVRTTQDVVAWVQVPVIAAPGWPNYVWVPIGVVPYPGSYPSSYTPTAPAHGGQAGPAPAAYTPAAPIAIQPQDAYYYPRQHEGVELAAAEHAPTHSPAVAAQHSDDRLRFDDASLPPLPTTIGQFEQDCWRNWENENELLEDRIF